MLRERNTHSRVRLATFAVLALLAPLQVFAVSAADDAEDGLASARVAVDAARPTPGWASSPDELAAGPFGTDVADPPAPVAAPPAAGQLVTEPDGVQSTPAPPFAPLATRSTSLADRFPLQAAATQDVADPATTRWALLIGINEHRGTVADNIGSRQDAEDLRLYLLANGWRDDHILMLTDRNATRADIVDGIAWLADRTDQDSVAVFHYSGHSKKWYGQDVDRDGEDTDEGLWPSDDRFIPDSELVRLLDPVRPQAFWVSFATCNAAGLADPGLAQPGRILTFSSGEQQKSYENPAWGNSVWGWLMFEQALATGVADADRDGRVTVQEAFAWARPRARDTTSAQRYGPQDGVIIDQLGTGFELGIPGAPPAPPSPPAQPAADQPASGSQPAPAPAPEPAPEEPPRERTEENHGNKLCLLCGR